MSMSKVKHPSARESYILNLALQAIKEELRDEEIAASEAPKSFTLLNRQLADTTLAEDLLGCYYSKDSHASYWKN